MSELSIHNLKPNKGSRKKVKRVGRGNASGKGTTAGRGTKGQNSRTGGRSGRALRGLRPLMLQTPKLRGFKSLKPKAQNVQLGDLEETFAAGEMVNPQILLKKGLIKSTTISVKILSGGNLTKKLTITGCKASAVAKAKIEEVGGEFRA